MPGQHPRDLPHAVGAVVKANAGIAIAYRAHRLPSGINHHEWLNKLVGHAVVITLFNSGKRIAVSSALDPAGHGVKGFLFPLPSTIPVHGKVAAAYAGDLAHANFIDLALQLFEIPNAARGQGIAAVEKGVDKDLLHPLLFCRQQKGVQMRLLRVNAPIGDQAQQVQGASPFAGVLQRLHDHRMPEKFAGANEIVNARDVHVHHSSRADVQVTDFAVTHLPIGQADEVIRSMKQTMRIFRQEPVVTRLTRQCYRIGETLRTITPAIQNGEYNRFFQRHSYSPALTAARPRNSAPWPSSSSMRSNWLYFAMRSVRDAEPVLI